MIAKRNAAFSDIQSYLQNNDREAIVQCLTDRYEPESAIYKHRYYKSIAADNTHGGSYLIIDDSMNCCWVPKQFFKPVFDPYGILTG